MLPGTAYTPERILHIVRRKAWLIVLPVALGVGAAMLIARTLPDRYRSETVIMLEQQRVPDEYVKSIAPAESAERIATLENQIRSRSRLERIITDLNLYADVRQTATMEDVIDQMNEDITIKADKATVHVAYVSGDAKTAQQVAERLSSLFIQENLRDREVLAEQTNSFLDTQLDQARRQLIEHEKKLEQYRLVYGNELPSQATTNLQAMQNTQTQLQASLDVSDRARERRLLLERQVADLESNQAADETAPEPAKESTADRLEAARAQLPVLLNRLKPDHPDVRSLKRTIRDLEAKVAAEEAQPPSRTAAARPRRTTQTDVVRQRKLRDLTEQISDIDRQLAERQRHEQALRSLIAGYQGKLDAVPKRESELIELSRDYASLQATYQSLLEKKQGARIAGELERKNIGPQFKILDAPKVPERPFSPNRPLIDVGGGGAGLIVGLLLIALAEYRDSTFKSEDDVERVLRLRVLAIMPRMAAERSRRLRFVVAGIAVVAIAGVVVVLWTGAMRLPY